MPGPQPRYSQSEILAAVTQHGTQAAAAKALAVDPSIVSRAVKLSGKPLPTAIKASGDEAEIVKHVHQKVRTLAELVKVCEIDLTTWEIEKWVCNKWEMGYVKRRADTAHTLPLFQIKVWLKRIDQRARTLQALREELVADIRKAAKPMRTLKPSRRFVNDGFMFEYAPTDLHMGKLSWGEETVTDYDLPISAGLFTESLDYLLERSLRLTAGKLEQILFVVGNDVCHIDGKRATTTAGTPMDVDTRYIKVYRRICEVHRAAVRRFLDVAPVKIVVVPGNHDEETSFHVGEILAATFEANKHVTVDNSPRLRKYHEFGVNLLGFTHGDSEKIAELPLTMAREQKDLWARCTEREWHIGHLHKGEQWSVGRIKRDKRDRPGAVDQELFSDKGVRIRRLASLSSHDAWHTKHAYMDRRTCEGFVFHKRAGFTADLSFNVDHLTGKAMTK